MAISSGGAAAHTMLARYSAGVDRVVGMFDWGIDSPVFWSS